MGNFGTILRGNFGHFWGIFDILYGGILGIFLRNFGHFSGKFWDIFMGEFWTFYG